MQDLVMPRAMRLLYLVWLNIPPLRPLADKLMTRAFDRMAQRWDALNDDPGRLDPLYAAVDRLQSPPARTLDMGCANGTVPIWLAERFPGAWSFGIDVSAEMVAEATTKAAAAGSSARFSVGRNQATDFADAEFDLVTLVNVPPAFDEIARLLAPGGSAIVVFTKGPDTWFYSSPKRLASGFAKQGIGVAEQGTRGRGEFTIATKR